MKFTHKHISNLRILVMLSNLNAVENKLTHTFASFEINLIILD